MAVTSRSNLKEYFQTGNQPTQTQFNDLIDSFVHIDEGDNNLQITDTLRISGSETYVSGAAVGTVTVTPQNEDFTTQNIETRTGFNTLGQPGQADPADVGKDPNDFFTSSISPTSGSLAALFDRNLSNEFGTILYYGPTGSHTGSIEFSGDTADGALSDHIKTGFAPFNNSHSINLFHDINTHDGFTLSYWVKPLEIGSLGNPMIALGRNNESTSEAFSFGIHGSNIYFDVGNTIISSSAHGMEIDRWYHWIIRGEGGAGSLQSLKAYRDGEEIFSGSYLAPSVIHANYPIYYGGQNSSGFATSIISDAWACKLSEVAIFHRSKSIEDLWDGSGNPVDLSGTNAETSASGLVLYHKLNEADVQEDGTIKDYGPYGYTASIGDGVSSGLNWSNDSTGPDSVSVDFYHRGHKFAFSNFGASKLTNVIKFQFIKGFEAQQIQISGSNDGCNSFDPLYGDTENIFHGQSNDYGANLAPFGYIQTDSNLNGLGMQVQRTIRFNTTTTYKHYRITYRNWQNQVLKPSDWTFGSSSGYFVQEDAIPVDSIMQLGLSVSGSILPGANDSFDLGSPDMAWRHLFLGGNSLKFINTSSGTERARVTISDNDAIEFGKSGQSPSVQIDQSGDQGFIAVMGEPNGQASTILRAENLAANGADYGMAGLEVKGSGSFKLMLGADHSSVSNYPNQKFIVEANGALPGIGKRLLTVSESGETKTNYLVANGLSTPTTIASNTNVPADHIMTLSTTRYKPNITVNEFVDLTVEDGADLSIKNVFA